MNRPPGKRDAGEELDLDEDPELDSAPRQAQQPRRPQHQPAPLPTASGDSSYAMPVDEPMLDLDGTSSDGLDLADPSLGRRGGTVFEGAPSQAAVDARELEFGLDAGAPADDDRMPSGIFETSEVDLAVEAMPGRLPTLETTPWEPSPGQSDSNEYPSLQPTGWEPTPGLEDDLPQAGGDPTLQATGWEPTPGGDAPAVEVATGARELDFGIEGNAPPSPQATPWQPPGAVPEPSAEGLADLELAMDPARPAEPDGTVFDGTGAPPAGAATPEGLDLSQRGPPDASLLSGEYPTVPGSGEFPAVGEAVPEGRARHTAAKELFRLIDKAIKQLNLYEGTGESCERPIAAAYQHLVEVLRAFGNLSLTVTPYEFLLDEEGVYVSEEDRRGISYRLFRDGVRELEILPHISIEEFRDLLEILRAVQPRGGEEDTVTQLWERNFSGLLYRAVDFFLEGMIISESERFQALIEELMVEPTRPLHSTQGVQVARQVMSQLSRELLQQAQQQRVSCVSALAGYDESEQIATVAQEPEQLTEELWLRTMQILVRMMELGRSVETSRVLVQIIEQMMTEGRWSMLGASCKALADVLRRGAVRSPEATRSLRDALTHLCSGNRLLALHNMLSSCSLSQYNQLAELLRILPREADPQLVVLVSRMPQNEVQEQLIALLKERGVDLTDFLAERLASPNLMHVLAAIEDLRKLGTAKSVAALRKASLHPSPRVRLEALRALTEHVDVSMLPQLVSALSLNHRDLRDLSLTLLERLPPDRALVPHMVQLTRQDSFEDWGPDHRTRLLKLLVRWGGPESNDFVIKTITALNPLRRKRMETLRMEMIRALGETGGRRAQQLLRACLDYRPSKPVRSAIELALRQVEQSP